MSFIAPDYSSSIELFQSSSKILSSAKLPEQPQFEKMQDATMNERNIGNTNKELLTFLSKKKEAKWPEWDGKSESLRTYLFELRVKIEEDRHLLGSNRAVCLVREVAERLESHKYRTQTTQTQTSPMTSSTSILNPSTKDAEGDTLMTGVNALFNLLNSGSQSNLNSLIAGLDKLQWNKSGQDNRP
ncbi:hypothetical protein GcC1_168017 [Golovinomyces cichoracearum]|uniref:Uncharacterized protein n=1 Tax=Golovinomyces cichoracearum TaxID=62708 RepID=A0A420HRY8_9PEZI|nr:hypothetical protein GcC1_168017 [Golovinomyces cichoracearum]